MNFFKTTYQKLLTDIKEVPPALRDNYFPVLDGLRGIAILMVLLPHFGINKYLWHFRFYLVSNTGVHMFFVLSGFLITTRLLKEKLQTGRISLKQFYIRRALRILPVAYLFLLVLIVLNQVYHLHISTADFIASFLFYKNLPMRNEIFTAHFWSLAVEEQFYFTFPLLLAININRYMFTAIALVIIIPAVAILSYLGLGVLHDNTIGQILAKVCMYAFWKGPTIILVGSVFSVLMFKGIINPLKVKVNRFASFICLVLAIAMATVNFPGYSKYTSEFISALLVGSAIVLTIGRKDFLSSILCSRLLMRVGVLSYSIYIWQELFVGRQAWQPWIKVFESYPVWLLILIKLIAIAGIASLSYSFEFVFLRIKSSYKYKQVAVK